MPELVQKPSPESAIRQARRVNGKCGDLCAGISNVITQLHEVRDLLRENQRTCNHVELQNNLKAMREVAKSEKLSRVDLDGVLDSVKKLRAESIDLNDERSKLEKAILS